MLKSNRTLEQKIYDGMPPSQLRMSIIDDIDALRREIHNLRDALECIGRQNGTTGQTVALKALRGDHKNIDRYVEGK